MRLFYGLEVKAPWPEKLPEGRLIEEHSRHLTTEFLGDVEEEPKDRPEVPYRMGPVGIFNEVLILRNVVAWHVDWLEDQFFVGRELLHHVTMARKPFRPAEWKETFSPLPVIGTALHLYESVGNLTYKPRWSYPLIVPFDEFEHTADIAFRIRGYSLEQLHLHAEIALAFVHPPLLAYRKKRSATTLDEVIIQLNELITRCDSAIGTPFKAVSFHGSVQEYETLEWEMIVDV